MQVGLVPAILIGVGGFAIGSVVGRLLRRRSAPSPSDTGTGGEGERTDEASQRDSYDEGPQPELWDQLMDTCYHDFRVQAVAGRDSEFFPSLHEPLFVAPEMDDNSPLLPGEITVTDVIDVDTFREQWARRRSAVIEGSAEMTVEDQQFYRSLYDDLMGNLGRYPAGQQMFRLAVRTPGHQHYVLLSYDLVQVVGVIPGPLQMQGPNAADAAASGEH